MKTSVTKWGKSFRKICLSNEDLTFFERRAGWSCTFLMNLTSSTIECVSNWFLDLGLRVTSKYISLIELSDVHGGAFFLRFSSCLSTSVNGRVRIDLGFVNSSSFPTFVRKSIFFASFQNKGKVFKEEAVGLLLGLRDNILVRIWTASAEIEGQKNVLFFLMLSSIFSVVFGELICAGDSFKLWKGCFPLAKL